MALMLTTDDKEAFVLDAPNGDYTNVRGKLKKSGREDDDNVVHFFRCVTLNHDCIVVNYEENKDLQQYQGQSIDEVCLLDMA